MGIKIVTATQGAGKTSFVQRYAGAAAARGLSVAGVVAPVVFDQQQRIGYDLIDLRTGQRKTLARLVANGGDAPDVGVYHFNHEVVREGIRSIVAAVRGNSDVIIIDEIGPLEFKGRGWVPAMKILLKEFNPQHELIVVVRPSLVDALPGRFPSPHWEAAELITPPWPVLSST